MFSLSDCKAFKEKITEVAESVDNKAGESEEATTTADLLNKLSVSSKDQGEKHEGKVASAALEKKDADEKLENPADDYVLV